MTQEEKQLLLRDLCARLPYGVKVHCEWSLFQGDRVGEDGELISIKVYTKCILFRRNSGIITEIPFNRIDGTVLPYLRPMSSMTEEEKAYKESYFKWDYTAWDYVDWLNKKMFDYRHLIPMGLALEASEDMYNLN